MAISDALGYDPSDPAGANSPVALEENKSKWRAFLDNFQDPNTRQAILQTGIGLLRSPRYGENSGDIIANALGTGASTLQGLRNMDYQRQQATQSRTDTQTQRAIENTRGDRQVANSERQTGIMEQTNIMNAGRENAQISETGRHNQTSEATARLEAEANMARAKAYSNVGARVPAEVQKINALAAQYMVEGQDETAARARAVMVVDSAKGATSPGEMAMNLFQNSVKGWQNDINNFGKTLTPQQIQQMQKDSIDTVMKFQQFNTVATGTPTAPAGIDPNNPRQGVVQRPAAGAAGSSPVGTIKSGYKKTKVGLDSDKTTWTKVNGNPK